MELDTDKLITNARDNHGSTPLMVAVNLNHKDFVDVLIKRGVSLIEKDNRGFTALHIAAEKNHHEIVELLLVHLDEQSVNCGSKFLQLTPLIVACRNTSVRAARKLLESPKCNQFTRDAGGYFALHYAISAGSLKLVQLLSKSRFPEYFKENGVHQNVLDCAVLTRWNEPSSLSRNILDFIVNIVGNTRELAQYKYVRQVTDLLIEQTNQKVQEELEKVKKQKEQEAKENNKHYYRRHYYGKQKELTTDLEASPSYSPLNILKVEKLVKESKKLLDPDTIDPKEVVSKLTLASYGVNASPIRKGSGRGKGGKGLSSRFY